MVLTFISCSNDVVTRAEYEAVVAYADSIEAKCIDLEFELMDLKLYNDYLEKELVDKQNEATF